MGRNVVTTTISLPRKIAKELRALGRREGMTTSELIRDALRQYQRARRGGVNAQSWAALQRQLRTLSKAGRKQDLANFIANDRTSH